MKPRQSFAAPWSKTLKVVTSLCVVLLTGIALMGVFGLSPRQLPARLGLIILPALILPGCALFMVRGYTLTEGRLLIHRLGWSSSLDLASLISATPDPLAAAGSIRACGIGGLFVFCGRFRNRKLGNYRLYATDLQRSVVLHFANRVVVVTPDAPDKFAAEIMGAKPS